MDIDKFVSLLPILKAGSSKENFPVYAPYLYSDGATVKTCNTNTFVQAYLDVGFKGCVNLHVLDSIVSKNDVIAMAQIGNILTVTSEKLKMDVSVVDIEFPAVKAPDPKLPRVVVGEGTLLALKTASKFIGKDMLSTIYVDEEGMIATDRRRVFMHKFPFDLVKPVSITSRIFNIINESFTFGSDDRNNTFVGFSGGSITFVVDPIEFYPAAKARKFVLDAAATEIHKLCNVAAIQDGIEKVSPILFGEMEQFVTLEASHRGLSITASSANGEATYSIEQKPNVTFSLSINAKYFANIPLSYDVYYVMDEKKLYLTDGENSYIVLLGAV